MTAVVAQPSAREEDVQSAGRAALRVALVALVLVNLGFVGLTGAADPRGLGFLSLVAISSARLSRAVHYRSYRSLWTLAVLALFGRLVRDLLAGGLHLLLEDGLLLAALCQVHLLCHLSLKREDGAVSLQRPDLLFFNSHLIALVTCFLCFDVEYSLLFVAYGLVVSVVLQLNALAGWSYGRLFEGVSPRRIRAAVGSGLLRGGLVLALTFTAFLLLPRDFQRTGLLGERFSWGEAKQLLSVDFDDEIELGRQGVRSEEERIVLKATRLHGKGTTMPRYWRGATLDHFDGTRWTASEGVRGAWRGKDHRWIREDAEPAAMWLAVDVLPGYDRLFLPRASVAVDWKGSDGASVEPTADGQWHVSGSPRFLHATVAVAEDGPLPRVSPMAPAERWLRLDHSVSAIGAWADQNLRSLDESSPPDVVARKLCRVLATNGTYLEPGESPARSVEEFLATLEGHCEWFATACVLALRSRGIPSRVVSGFLADPWPEDERTHLVKSRQAHSWVEFLGLDERWHRLDPTPSASSGADTAGDGWWAAGWARIESIWSEITGFDDGTRHAWWNRLLASRWWVLSGFVSIGVVAMWRRRRHVPPTVVALERALRRAGQEDDRATAPRELLERALKQGGRPQALASLERAVRAHERARYAVPAVRDEALSR